MRGIVWDGQRLHVTDELSVRDPGPGEVRVRVHASGICHSDLFVMDYPHPHLPIVLGHEAAGIIDRVGPDVKGRFVGEPVTVGCHTPCGTCDECRRGNSAACPEGWGSPSTPFSWRGTPAYSMSSSSSFAQQIVIKASQAYNCEGIPDKEASLIGCAVSTGVGAVRNLAKVRAGDNVVVIVVGGIGVNAIQGARAAGAAGIIAVDLDERKFSVARSYGATDSVQVARDDSAEEFVRKVLEAVARVDVVIECSGAPTAIEAMMMLPGIGGRAVLIGLPPPDCQVRFSPMGFLSGKSLISGYNGGTTAGANFQALVEDVRQGRIEVASQISRIWPLDRVEEAVAALRRGEVTRAVLDMR
jgi:S-(hydroxymethyl)glutathione dehydrogenase / alcohol dehydrogenase